MRNGARLAQAAARFDVLVTTDQNLRHQQNPDRLPIPFVEIDTRDTRIQSLQAIASFLPMAIEATSEFNFVSVAQDGSIERLAKRPPKT